MLIAFLFLGSSSVGLKNSSVFLFFGFTWPLSSVFFEFLVVVVYLVCVISAVFYPLSMPWAKHDRHEER